MNQTTLRRGGLVLALAAAAATFSATARAQTQPPPAGYPPPPPQGYAPPPPQGYAPPPPQGYAPPQGYPPPQGYAPPQAGYAAAPGYYPPQPMVQSGPPPGAQTHDGFYLRLMLGPGYVTMNSSTNGVDTSLHGFGGSVNVAVGGIILPNLALFGEFMATNATDPKRTQSGVSTQLNDWNAGVFGIGPGVAYYVMPVNVALTASLLLTGINAENTTTKEKYKTNVGPGIEIGAGKEFWISDNWGLGATALFSVGTMKDSTDVGPKPTWTTIAFSLNFTATFN